MNWACELTEDAERDLRNLPRNIQRRVTRVLDQMTADPFQGDVKALKGPEWRGMYRRRIGSYRILFTVGQGTQTAFVVRILIRSEKTYS